MRHIALILGTVLGVLCTPLAAYAYQSPGNPTGFVNDFAQILSIDQKNTLEEKLGAFNATTSNEIAVVTIRSLEGDTIENYANKLFVEWGIGKEKTDNGVLLLVAVNDRQMRIEVGYGLEGAIPDAAAYGIISNILTPRFKEGNYFEGIDAAGEVMMALSQGEYAVAENVGNDMSRWWKFLTDSGPILFVFMLLSVQFFASILGRSKSWWLGGVLGGIGATIIGAYVVHTLFAGAILFFVLVLLGLLFDYIVSSQYQQSVASGNTPPWWTGGRGFRGGSSSGGSHFGGFGGGSSGGGGASGRW